MKDSCCRFCMELNDDPESVYAGILGSELPSRIIHSTSRYVLFPPLGEFIEGGLLLLTQEHYLSFARLPSDYYDELESIMLETADLLSRHYGCFPLFFEHAPKSENEKGTCCVDHAHLNVFPASVDILKYLKEFSYKRISMMNELAEYKNSSYLFLQTNQKDRFVFDVDVVPSQYFRKIITHELGIPDRWDWHEYMGLEELKKTYYRLLGWK